MSAICARVQASRLVVNAPTSLRDGTVLNPVVDDEGDEFDATERASLDAAISCAWAAVQAGQWRAANEVIAALRKR
jgi:hypothetical protein